MIERHTPPAHGSVVVGVDGSEQARHALAVALRLARGIRAACHVVHTWSYPTMAMAAPVYVPPVAFEDVTPRHRLWLDKVLAEAPTEGVVVTREVRQGPAGPALVQVAAELDAPFLIVGSVGHGAVIGTLLGSVSQHCVHHATCPVVVVPPADRALTQSSNGTDAVRSSSK